jgi:hypothetical protein
LRCPKCGAAVFDVIEKFFGKKFLEDVDDVPNILGFDCLRPPLKIPKIS